MTSVELYVLNLVRAAARNRAARLQARMRGAQIVALRHARHGAHGRASDWWKAMVRAHLVRRGCTRPAAIFAAARSILAESVQP